MISYTCNKNTSKVSVLILYVQKKYTPNSLESSSMEIFHDSVKFGKNHCKMFHLPVIVIKCMLHLVFQLARQSMLEDKFVQVDNEVLCPVKLCVRKSATFFIVWKSLRHRNRRLFQQKSKVKKKLAILSKAVDFEQLE